MIKNYSEYVKRRLKASKNKPISYTKTNINSLFKKSSLTKNLVEKNLRNPKRLEYAEKQYRTHKGYDEERYLSHFIPTNKKGISTVLKFNNSINVITAFPVGKGSIRKIKRKFKK